MAKQQCLSAEMSIRLLVAQWLCTQTACNVYFKHNSVVLLVSDPYHLSLVLDALQVLNGQQRMVTLYILLALLRYIAKLKEYDNCLRIIDDIKAFKFKPDRPAGEEKVRFMLRPSQQPYFESWFLNDPAPLWKDFFDLGPDSGVDM